MTNILNQNQDQVSLTDNIIEENMDTTNQLVTALISHFTSNPQNFTDYRKDVESILREYIKPISTRSGKVAGTDGWRDEVKKRFSGRGAKWVFISLEDIESTLLSFENDGVDCSQYRTFTSEHKKAWIRFSGPRVKDNIQCASFEVRTGGSTVDHPRNLHYIPVDKLSDVILMTVPGTPKSLKLESDSAPMPRRVKVEKVKPVVVKTSDLDMLAHEINVELNDSPESNDPEDWEAFLAAEGLIDDEMDNL